MAEQNTNMNMQQQQQEMIQQVTPYQFIDWPLNNLLKMKNIIVIVPI